MAITNIGQSNWAVQGLDVNMRVVDVAHVHIRGVAFHDNVALQFLRMQRPGHRSQVSHWHPQGTSDLVIHLTAILVGPANKMGHNIHAIAAMALVDFDLI